MGIFSSTYKTYVGTSISRFADMDTFVSSKYRGVISGISRNEDIVDHTLDYLLAGPGQKAKTAFRFSGDSYVDEYGDTRPKYIFGRPQDYVVSASLGNYYATNALKDYLLEEYGTGISFLYYMYGVNNYFHAAFKLLSAFGINSDGELPKLTEEKLFKCYFYSLNLIVNSEYKKDAIKSFERPNLPSEIITEIIGSEEEQGVTCDVTYRYVKVVSNTENSTTTVDPFLYSTYEISNFEGGPNNYTDTINTSSTDDPVIVVTTTTATGALAEDEYQKEVTKITTTSVTIHYVSVVTSYVVDTPPPPPAPIPYTPPTPTGTKTVEEYHSSSTYHVKVTKVTSYKQENKKLGTELTFSDEDRARSWYMACFVVPGSTKPTFFEYATGGIVPELNDVIKPTYDYPGNFMPRLYLRWNFQPGTVNVSPYLSGYKNSKKLAKRMGVDYDKLVEEVHDLKEGTPDARTADDLSKIISAYISYYVPADASSMVEQKYLYHHFKDLHQNIGGKESLDTLETFLDEVKKSDFFEHAAVIYDKRFKTVIGMQGIWKREVIGTFPINKKGVYSRHSKDGEYGFTSGELSISETITQQHSRGDFTYTTTEKFPYHVYRFQHIKEEYETINKYTEYQVIGLYTKYFVKDDYYSTGIYLEDENSKLDLLYVPINYDIVKEFGVFEREELMYSSLQFVANSLEVVKVKWYQRSGWANVFKVAAIVAAVFGFAEGFEFVHALISVAGVSIAWAIELIWFYLKELISVYLVAYTFVKVGGTDLAMLAAIIMSISGYGNSMGLKTTFATDMLSYSNAIFKEINRTFTKEFKALKGEYDSLLAEAKEEILELTNALEDVKPNSARNNLTASLLSTTPTEFLNKPHIGNIGTKSFDLLHNYVDISLHLPNKPTYLEV